MTIIPLSFFTPLQNAKWAKGILQFIRYLLRQVSMDFTRWSRLFPLRDKLHTVLKVYMYIYPWKYWTAHFTLLPPFRRAQKSWLPQIIRGWAEVSGNDWAWVRAVIKTRDGAPPAFLRKSKWQNHFFVVFGERTWCFSAHLSKLLIDDPKLEIVAYHMFIEGHNEPRCLWTWHNLEKRTTHCDISYSYIHIPPHSLTWSIIIY